MNGPTACASNVQETPTSFCTQKKQVASYSMRYISGSAKNAAKMRQQEQPFLQLTSTDLFPLEISKPAFQGACFMNTYLVFNDLTVHQTSAWSLSSLHQSRSLAIGEFLSSQQARSRIRGEGSSLHISKRSEICCGRRRKWPIQGGNGQREYTIPRFGDKKLPRDGGAPTPRQPQH
jgi:hypothetical protein